MQREIVRKKSIVRLSRDWREKINKAADQEGVTKNAMLERIVELGLDAYETLSLKSS